MCGAVLTALGESRHQMPQHCRCQCGKASSYGDGTAARGFSVASVSTSTVAMRKNPAPAVNAIAGPSPAALPKPRSLTNATEVGPSPAPSATLKKKLTAIAKPRCRFGTTSSIEEKPQAVTIPDSAKYSGTAAITILTCAASMAQHTGRMTRLETRDRKSTRLNSSHTVISYAVF